MENDLVESNAMVIWHFFPEEILLQIPADRRALILNCIKERVNAICDMEKEYRKQLIWEMPCMAIEMDSRLPGPARKILNGMCYKLHGHEGDHEFLKPSDVYVRLYGKDPLMKDKD